MSSLKVFKLLETHARETSKNLRNLWRKHLLGTMKCHLKIC